MPDKIISPAASVGETGFFGHPRGLMTLFFTEMWERFSYYGMRAILILYMVAAPQAGGLGFSDSKAGIIYGIYVAVVYMLSVPGGWIADRFIGQRKAVWYGGWLIMFGHIALAVPRTDTFYVGLFLIVIGTGLLKPNISTIVGQLYAPEDERRDGGFTLYYMGINIGAFFSPLVCGFLAQSETFRNFIGGFGLSAEHAWHFGFGAAAVGMFLGMMQYRFGDRDLKDAGKHPAPAPSAEAAAHDKRNLIILLVGLVVIVLGAVGLAYSNIDVSIDTLTVVILIALSAIPSALFLILFTSKDYTAAEKARFFVILALFFGATVFFTDFEQAGSTFNLFAERNTTNELLGIKFPASFMQSVNAAFILVLAPIAAALWTYLAKRGKNPTSMAKFAVGMFLLGLGCLVMYPSGAVAEAGGKVSPMWLILLYFLHTCAELCVSPVGLSTTTRVAPARVAGMAMGIWFAGTALGNYLSGVAVGMTASFGLTKLFIVISIPPMIAAVIFAFIVKPVKNMLARHE